VGDAVEPGLGDGAGQHGGSRGAVTSLLVGRAGNILKQI